MASQGPNSPSAASNDASSGAVAWSNPTNCYSSNNVLATSALTRANPTTNLLVATGFGFTIPSGATIDGIVVGVERSKTGPIAAVRDYLVYIVKGGVVGATNRATTTLWPASENSEDHGGASDLWGETWTDSDINASNFGVAVSGQMVYGTSTTAQIDHIRITVYYTASGSSVSVPKTLLLGVG